MRNPPGPERLYKTNGYRNPIRVVEPGKIPPNPPFAKGGSRVSDGGISDQARPQLIQETDSLPE